MVGFKIFLVIILLLVPGVMLGMGYFWKKHPPKDINGLYGYRSRRSMQNDETWAYAHEVCGRLWRTFGWFCLALTMVSMVLFFFPLNEDQLGYTVIGIEFLQLVLMIIAIPVTERALKRKYDI